MRVPTEKKDRVEGVYPRDVVKKHFIIIAYLQASVFLPEEPTRLPLLEYYTPMQQPTYPFLERNSATVVITDGQTVPPVSGLTLESSVQGDHNERIWV